MERIPVKRCVAAALALLCACANVRAIVNGASSPRAPAKLRAHPGDFVFGVLGDWGAGTEDQARVARAMCAARKAVPFADVVTVGDNFYNPDGHATQSNYYGPMACVLAYPGHRWRAAWGNHDVAGPSTRTVLGAQRRYTWTSHGVQFFMLDSNDPGSVSQRAWLERSLRASRARVKVAVLHSSPYSAGGVHSPDAIVRANWVPLFERYHVSLVLAGHEHDYEHFKVNGIHYVLTGGGGALVYGCLNADPHLLKCEATHEFLVVAIGASRFAVTAVGADGAVLDSFSAPLG
jgi:3',5'-cyclic AMP phosphodiesterase CpdA